MKVELSILIPSTPDRKEDLQKLLECIDKQEYVRKVDMYDVDGLKCERYWDILCPIEVLVFEDAKIMTIGEKRELLYKHAKGTHSIQVDSDDLLAPNATHLILEAIRNNPDVDCITFEEHIDIDGKIQRSNHSLKYADWANGTDGFDYVRTPFMKSVIKTEIAKSVPIPHIRFGEDHQWAQALKPHLKTEIHIDEQIYKYIHRSSDFNERYGIVEKRNENSEPTNY